MINVILQCSTKNVAKNTSNSKKPAALNKKSQTITTNKLKTPEKITSELTQKINEKVLNDSKLLITVQNNEVKILSYDNFIPWGKTVYTMTTEEFIDFINHISTEKHLLHKNYYQKKSNNIINKFNSITKNNSKKYDDLFNYIVKSNEDLILDHIIKNADIANHKNINIDEILFDFLTKKSHKTQLNIKISQELKQEIFLLNSDDLLKNNLKNKKQKLIKLSNVNYNNIPSVSLSYKNNINWSCLSAKQKKQLNTNEYKNKCEFILNVYNSLLPSSSFYELYDKSPATFNKIFSNALDSNISSKHELFHILLSLKVKNIKIQNIQEFNDLMNKCYPRLFGGSSEVVFKSAHIKLKTNIMNKKAFVDMLKKDDYLKKIISDYQLYIDCLSKVQLKENPDLIKKMKQEKDILQGFLSYHTKYVSLHRENFDQFIDLLEKIENINIKQYLDFYKPEEDRVLSKLYQHAMNNIISFLFINFVGIALSIWMVYKLFNKDSMKQLSSIKNSFKVVLLLLSNLVSFLLVYYFIGILPAPIFILINLLLVFVNLELSLTSKFWVGVLLFISVLNSGYSCFVVDSPMQYLLFILCCVVFYGFLTIHLVDDYFDKKITQFVRNFVFGCKSTFLHIKHQVFSFIYKKATRKKTQSEKIQHRFVLISSLSFAGFFVLSIIYLINDNKENLMQYI